MYKRKIEAMVTKFSKKFAIIMLKKHRKFCRGGLAHLAATPTFQKSFRSFWFTLYGYFFHSFCVTDLNFGTQNNGGMKYSTLKTVIFASYWGSPLVQFSKFINFLWVCWFLGKNLSNPPLENFSTPTAIIWSVHWLGSNILEHCSKTCHWGCEALARVSEHCSASG